MKASVRPFLTPTSSPFLFLFFTVAAKPPDTWPLGSYVVPHPLV